MDAQAIDPLVAAAIHDAKNALMNLDARLAEAEHRPASADFRAARADVARITAQLSELLTLYRAHNGVLRLAIDDHDLADFLDEIAVDLTSAPAGIRLDIERDDAARIGAWAFDAYLVKLALLDALRNALRNARSRVALTLQVADGGGIRFSVIDDGPGFPEPVLKGAADYSNGDGTGLGIRFARLIASRHATPDGRRGSIELANTPGARFSLLLP